MRHKTAGWFLVAVSFALLSAKLGGQTVENLAPVSLAEDRLQAALEALAEPGAPHPALAEAMLRLARPDHQPQAYSVVSFADALAAALAERTLPDPALARIRQTIVSLMHGDFSEYTITNRLREALLAAGAELGHADLAASRGHRIAAEIAGRGTLPLRR
jgi:hypothetical protein